jgi:hypothetical protein
MEERIVKLSLDKAKEYYNSNNEALKSIALQAFTEEELVESEYPAWNDIKCWKDVVNCKLTDPEAREKSRAIQKIDPVLGALYRLRVTCEVINTLYKKQCVLTEKALDKKYLPCLTVFKFNPRLTNVRKILYKGDTLYIGINFLDSYALVPREESYLFKGIECSSIVAALHIAEYFVEDLLTVTLNK